MDLKKLAAGGFLLAVCILSAKTKEAKNPHKLGHLLIEVVSVTTPEEVKGWTSMRRKPNQGEYLVAIHV